jgi:hypothetical protein
MLTLRLCALFEDWPHEQGHSWRDGFDSDCGEAMLLFWTGFVAGIVCTVLEGVWLAFHPMGRSARKCLAAARKSKPSGIEQFALL